jgi:flagellar motor switch protein FliN/FliY
MSNTDMPTTEAPSTTGSGVVARLADFPELAAAASAAGLTSLDNLLDVPVTVTAELGRTRLPLANILKLGVGAVVELDRGISEPVDLLVQGTLLAKGEVVVVDDRFAIRIKQIVDPRYAATK